MAAQLSRPPMVTPFGKCTSIVKTMVPEETENLIMERAALCRTTPAEVVRNVLLKEFHGGVDMVAASLVEQFLSTVRTGTGTGAEVKGA